MAMAVTLATPFPVAATIRCTKKSSGQTLRQQARKKAPVQRTGAFFFHDCVKFVQKAPAFAGAFRLRDQYFPTTDRRTDS